MNKQDQDDRRIQTALQELIPVPPRDPKKAARGKAEFLKQASELRQAVSTPATARHRRRNVIPRKEKFVMNFLVSILLALAVLAGGGATVSAAQNDLPGEPLYQVKLFSEDVRLLLNADPQSDIEMLMQMSQERVREMAVLSKEGLTPPEQVALRLEGHMRQALQLTDTLDGNQFEHALQTIQTSLQMQEQLMAQAQTQSTGDAQKYLFQTQTILQNRLRLVDEGLADPQGFRYNTRNETQFGQDESVTSSPNEQGEPGFHLNEQATSDGPDPENGQNGKRPQSTQDAPGLEITLTPTPMHGRGPGGGNQSGNK